MAPTQSQRYLSTRGGFKSGAEEPKEDEAYDLSFEKVVLKGLAADGGLFIPEEIPSLPDEWALHWKHISFDDLAYEILSLYISADEIPPWDLRSLITKSFASFRHPDVTPLITLNEDHNLYLLELFHGPTFAFKDVALQMLGNLFEYFLVRRNKESDGKERHHLTVIGATSGDTGSAAIYGLRGKKDVSVFILHPKGKVSPVQEAQMTTVLDANVHNIAVEGTFDDCQDIVKALFADPEINKTHNLAAVNSINWARILSQIIYYFHSYLALLRSKTMKGDAKIRFVVPTGNFGDILAGYLAKRMGLPIDKLVIATNENDILDRFWKSGHYEKKPVHGRQAEGGLSDDGAKAHTSGVKETLSPAMDILVSSNFERLLWFLARRTTSEIAPSSTEQTLEQDATSIRASNRAAARLVANWLHELKTKDGFNVAPAILALAKEDFESERVSDEQTIETIQNIYAASDPQPSADTRNERDPDRLKKGGYVLDPHSAIGIAASFRSIARNPPNPVAPDPNPDSTTTTAAAPPPQTFTISLATAHPAKFANAVDLALKGREGFDFEKILPEQFRGLEGKEKRMLSIGREAGWEGVRVIIREEVAKELAAAAAGEA